MTRKKPAELFEDIVGAFGLPVPEREYRFHPEREWRFDYAWIPGHGGHGNWKFESDGMPSNYICNGKTFRLIAVEIQGGRYHRGKMAKDYEKLNEAQRLGWTVYQFSTDMLASEIKRYEVGQFMEAVLKGGN